MSRFHEWLNTALRLECCADASRDEDLRKSRLPLIDSAILAGGKWRTQAAANTMPSGRPSTSLQISSTVGVLSVERVKSDCTLLARSSNNRTAPSSVPVHRLSPIPGYGSPDTSTRYSACRSRCSLDVTSTVIFGALLRTEISNSVPLSTRFASSQEPPPRKCSKLSSTNSISLSWR